jgi:hypothetical protein
LATRVSWTGSRCACFFAAGVPLFLSHFCFFAYDDSAPGTQPKAYSDPRHAWPDLSKQHFLDGADYLETIVARRIVGLLAQCIST